jgi:hypothetical protein
MKIIGYIQLATEAMALIASVACFRQLRILGWLLWIPFLIYTCTIEIAGAWIAQHDPTANNLWLYNPYIVISLAFYEWFLIHVSILGKKIKRWLYVVVLLLGCYSLSWYLVWGDPLKLMSYTLNTGAVTITLLCLLFFYTQIRNPEHHQSLMKVPGFWTVAGLLIFYTGISLYTALYSFLAKAHITIIGVSIQNLIPQVLSLFLYTAITVDFIQCKYRLKIS